MTEPKTLTTATDYRPALLWLMGQDETRIDAGVIPQVRKIIEVCRGKV